MDNLLALTSGNLQFCGIGYHPNTYIKPKIRLNTISLSSFKKEAHARAIEAVDSRLAFRSWSLTPCPLKRFQALNLPPASLHFRTVRDSKMSQFFARDFTQDRWRKAALKNAYSLLGKQRFEHAAAFFLLAGSLWDAIQVLICSLLSWTSVKPWSTSFIHSSLKITKA